MEIESNNTNNPRKIPFLCSDLGCLTVLGTIGTASIGSFTATYSITNNVIASCTATLSALALASLIGDRSIKASVERENQYQSDMLSNKPSLRY
jgi:hypothetical protein